VGVLRSLGQSSQDRLVGLAYDALDPGIYAKDLVDDVFLLPYPSSSVEAFFDRLTYIHERVGLDVILPTLDSELPAFIALEPRLRAMGIGLLLPTRDQLDRRAKAKLAELGTAAQIDVPRTVVLSSEADLGRLHEKLTYPFLLKGVFYGATFVRSYEEALGAFRKVVAEWGLPVIAQGAVYGEELNVVALGDGEGGMLGAVPMKKLMLTDKGKGWAGVTIDDRELLDVAARFVRATRWRGPCEVEVIRDGQGNYQLLEINPRFPAWVHLATAAGMNLPRATALLAAGEKAPIFRGYEVGTMFVRISLDQITSLGDMGQMLTVGEISRRHAAGHAA
jgi:carbamoyl-phosphate synthase large subunit